LELVAAVHPCDAREAADQADILAWVASGKPLFRTAPPATPPKHLVVYFIPVDTANGCLLLGDHRKSGLWLPPGGHVEEDEDPHQAVIRETREELGIAAQFHPAFGGGKPFFLTVTPTNNANSHLDVDLWFVLRAERDAPLFPDAREFKGVRWFGLDEQRDWPASTYDPEMHRFAGKLKSAIGGMPALCRFRAPLGAGCLKCEIPARLLSGDRGHRSAEDASPGHGERQPHPGRRLLQAMAGHGFNARGVRDPGELGARSDVGDLPDQVWQAGLLDPGLAAEAQRAVIKPPHRRHGLGPLRPGFHISDNLPHAFLGGGDVNGTGF
jgi:8-oxo-dGTP pyrophosphatase MutT (NUDIX family)